MKIAGISVVWSVAFGITLPYTMSHAFNEKKASCVCTYPFTPIGSITYIISLIVTGWGIPLLVISWLYTKCILKLKAPLASNNNAATNLRRAENNKVVNMFIIIAVLFFVLTIPYSVLIMVICYQRIFHKDDVDMNTAMKWNYALFTMTTANSCFNPIIYAKLHKDVNKFVNKLCKYKKRKEPRPGDLYEMLEVVGGGIK